MKNYDKNIELSYIEYLDANNLYGWVISQNLPVKGFKWVKKAKLSKFTKTSLKNMTKIVPKNLFDSHKDLPFLPERKKVGKVEKLICSIEDKEKYVIDIRALKQTLNHGLKLKKVDRIV